MALGLIGILTVCTPAAIAACVSATAAFGALTESLGNSNMSIYLFCVVAGAIIAALTASTPASIMISVPLVLSVALARGLNFSPDAIVRIAAFTSITFESLPWAGAFLVVKRLSQTTHKECYMAYFMQTVFFTTLAAVAAALLASVGIV